MPPGPSTQIADIITPESWELIGPYVRQQTVLLTEVLRSGMATTDAQLDAFLRGGGTTGNYTSWQSITTDDDDDNVSTDAVPDIMGVTAPGTADFPRNDAVPAKLKADKETYVRLSRNKAWGAADLSVAIAGDDPLMVVAEQIAQYRATKLQKAVIATWRGVVADNAANDTNDYTFDVSGSSYSAGTTDLSAAAVINAMQTLGDHKSLIRIICVHSVVHARMQLNNLIDFTPDSESNIGFGTFLGKTLVVDDAMPVATGNVYDTWMFGPGATKIGMGDPKRPMEVHREPLAGAGGGQENLISRWEWVIHPVGHSFTGTVGAGGGPTNANLAAAGSWDRAYPNRKQISFARLVTREA